MPRPSRGRLVALAATTLLAVAMFLPGHLGIVAGLPLVLVAAGGLLASRGLLTIAARTSPPPIETAPPPAPPLLRALARFHPPLLWAGLGLAVAGLARLSVLGTPAATAPWSGPLLLGLALVVVGVARVAGGRRTFDGDWRLGWLVFALAAGWVLSTLGSQGLWDCWETHYGEVARRQLEADDWISLWWENEWFYSKPILIFWMMDLGMLLFGATYGPDRIHLSPGIEWGVRFLVGALSIAVVVGVYHLLARLASRRAGLFAALALLSMPLWVFMTRQAITDLPFVGFMTLATIFLLLALTADRDEQARPFWHLALPGGRVLSFGAIQLVIGGYLAVVLPQLVYLATRASSFLSGSRGQENVKVVKAAGRLFDVHLSSLDRLLGGRLSGLLGRELGGAFDWSLDWLLLGLALLVPFVLVLGRLMRETRRQVLLMHGAYLGFGLSVMAKGLPGLVMPILALGGLWLIRAPLGSWRRPGELWRWHRDWLTRLDLGRGAALFLFVAGPWYLAMTVRHGVPFLTRFFYHDHFKRLAAGVHGDTGTFAYVAEQLSYAAFPWIALLPLGVLAGRAAVERRDGPPRAQGIVRPFVLSWTLTSFALLVLMVTKFHHYVFPVLPPLALLVGLTLDDLWERPRARVGVLVLAGLAILVLVTRELLVAPGTLGAMRGDARLVSLFIYKYTRPYPSEAALDFTRELTLFGLAFVATLGLALVPRLRRLAVVLFVVCGLGFGHFVGQIYMPRLAPHWTQKHLIDDYYAQRRSPRERLVAFQMNWKGENFYTGNRVVVFVSTKDRRYDDWIKKRKGERHFFITEPSRFKGMSRRTDAASGELKPLADTCNKYRIGVADEL